MKISEIADVVQHPTVAKEVEFTALLRADENSMDNIVEFIMDDRNAEARRLSMLRHLDELLGGVEDAYNVSDLQSFMYDQDNPPEPSKRHLRVVEQPDDDISTGEYEVCQTCGGTGKVHWDHTDEWSGAHVPAHASCPDCEEGLKDITGMHKMPSFDDLKNA